MLRAGVSAAVRRGAPLRVLHAVHPPATYFDSVLTAAEIQAAWVQQDTTDLAALVAGFEDTDLVSIDVDVVLGSPADVLLEASAETDLLVLGRHDAKIPFGSHLGPVCRAMIREALCPVLLVDPRP